MWSHEGEDAETSPYVLDSDSEEEEYTRDNPDLPVAAMLCEEMNRANEKLLARAPKVRGQAQSKLLETLGSMEKTGCKVGDAVGKAFGGLERPEDKNELQEVLSPSAFQKGALRKELRPALSKSLRIFEDCKDAALPLIESVEAKAKDCLQPIDAALYDVAMAEPPSIPSAVGDVHSSEASSQQPTGSSTPQPYSPNLTPAAVAHNSRSVLSSRSKVAKHLRLGYEELTLLFEASLRSAEGPIGRIERSILQHVAIPLDRPLGYLAAWGDKKVQCCLIG